MTHLLNKILGRVLLFLWERASIKRKARLLDSHPFRGALQGAPGIMLSVGSINDARRLGAVASEPYTARWIMGDMQDGDCLYDIGASVGAYSFIAARAHAGVKAYAFEPAAASFASLLANVAQNNMGEQIVPLAVALSNTTGFTEFAYASLSSGATKQPGIHESDRSAVSARQVVYAWTLDDLISQAKLALPTHIKVDVDGSEVAVVRGMKKTLALSQVRLVQVEASQGKDGTAGAISALLADAGFTLAETNRADNLRATDYLFRRR